ncbi:MULTISPECIES: SulP family inorganic anion transporter [unclassified Arenibacter]|uniref:SulP family inorganic anion transporter n=1 Tax=unclassified Arenibacter TaxID=2615047 RepID=UPI000E350C32|nr:MULTISPECIES: solute carrier family 26 protein [unclassified Arenibacter]MCM4164229.1 sodium-independent anion transporter [Arenibacter sp. A80]RFT56021.1 solute carrier 26 family protein [Arenibacter sp. P308M17]
MRRFLPFLDWFPQYNKNLFGKDLMAGITVGIILIPQGMAYAMIAGLPPVYGLYASLLPVLVYALLGTSRKIAVGPVAMDSLLVAAGLGTLAISGVQNYIVMALLLSFMVGAFQLIFGFLRMGFLVNFMSRPVISGFTSAAAVIIIFSQLKHLLGADIINSNKFHQLVINAFQHLSETNMYDFSIGITGILIIASFKKWFQRFPAILLVVVLSTLVVYFFNLEAYDVQVVGEVPAGLPSFNIHNFTMEKVREIWPIALTLALVGYLEAISIGRAFEEKDKVETIDPNQELIALGASNMIGSFFQSYSVTASFSRSAINYEAGAKTTVASVISVVMVAITLLFLTPLFYNLPKAALASIIMVSVFGLIDLSYPKKLWNQSKDEFFVLLVTFIITLGLGIVDGILIGVLMSLLLMVYRTSKPHFAVLGNIKGSDYYKNVDRFGDEVQIRPDILIVRFDSELYFGNSAYFKSQLFNFINAKGPSLKAVILNAEAINYIDASASAMLIKVIGEIHNRNIGFYISGATGPIRDIIFRSGIINCLHKEYLFVKIKEAVAYHDDPNTIPMLRERVAYQNQSN